MARGYTREKYLRIIDTIRRYMPDAAISADAIVGFPGETPADVEALLKFLEYAQLDRVGVFTYSLEEGTPSYDLPDKVSAREAAHRRREIMTLQQEISRRKHQALVGHQAWVLIDEAATETAPAVGRLPSQAPDIDGVVYVDGPVESGDLVPVEITSADAYDLTARLLVSAAVADLNLLHQRDH
jgi:ribosomal protein S12 methylthiotransferase